MNAMNRNTGLFGGFGIDTILVLFFLAFEYGRAVQVFSVDGALMLTTMSMVLVLPYFLPSKVERPSFGSWMKIRAAIAVIGLVGGVFYGRSIGFILPESLKFVPMTFLVLTGMVSCYVQFYALMKLRLVK